MPCALYVDSERLACYVVDPGLHLPCYLVAYIIPHTVGSERKTGGKDDSPQVETAHGLGSRDYEVITWAIQSIC